MADRAQAPKTRRKGAARTRGTVSILDVANAAGLSTATISRTLKTPEKVSEPTRARVLKAVEKTGYRPNMLARNLRSDRSFAMLVLVPGIANPFFSAVIAGVESVATGRGYSVLLGDTRDQPEREDHFAALVQMRLADGIIQLSPEYRSDDHRQVATYPIVHACGCELTPGSSIRIDNVRAAFDIVTHLIARGHRRIAAIGGPERNPHTGERLEGYRQALDAAGLAFDPRLVKNGDFTMASGAAAAQALLEGSTRPSAVFCMNDQMAIAAMQVLVAAGLRIPADIAVVGFDGLDMAAHCNPPLTTVEQPAFEMGVRAAELLLDQIEGTRGDEVTEVLPHRLIARQSTALPMAHDDFEDRR